MTLSVGDVGVGFPSNYQLLQTMIQALRWRVLKRRWNYIFKLHRFTSDFRDLGNVLEPSPTHYVSYQQTISGGGKRHGAWGETVEFVIAPFPGWTSITM